MVLLKLLVSLPNKKLKQVIADTDEGDVIEGGTVVVAY